MNDYNTKTQIRNKHATFWEKISATIWFRVVFAVAIPTALLFPIRYLYLNGSPFRCLFHDITGMYCPGCGSGRAAYDILHFQFLKALRNNLLFPFGAVFIAYYFLAWYLKIIFRKNVLPIPRLSINAYIVIMVLIIVFAVIRNIRVFPFTLLAPQSGGL